MFCTHKVLVVINAEFYMSLFVIFWVVHLLLNMEENDAVTNGFSPSVVKHSKLAFRVSAFVLKKMTSFKTLI